MSKHEKKIYTVFNIGVRTSKGKPVFIFIIFWRNRIKLPSIKMVSFRIWEKWGEKDKTQIPDIRCYKKTKLKSKKMKENKIRPWIGVIFEVVKVLTMAVAPPDCNEAKGKEKNNSFLVQN
ncbi:hypothetical protein ERO13_D03G088050v2 [Gossypium hirsutum]|uniref:Uncharacterized protein n=5 Tax=Gossypium TaxID=3633 RepID=A0A0D2QPN6_GOSRA|nr:hypothetical protein ES319_D03G105500v1 [Gossypium barbadense]KAG4155035.1 hypothetical protein ERO13_D03G088050v2 [Gossypium hirsutum]KJB18886.1 hypothetical protein B456_003G073900 [Gossypium raimondii]TYG76435.1 hypothetical protein ES288_D03G114200v1 [Gossypium darwinii]TYH80126.1 hypothetical protein ES332_D03G110900v1 [Gossypium tomentosum]TYI90120.1 hypothetical protein E1A91_D03G100500v1 [Gossypium mustelinum]